MNREMPKMWEEGKTIIMKKEMLERWLSDLRSGKFRQAAGALYVSVEKAAARGVNSGFCCLGVLCSQFAPPEQLRALSLPLMEWFEEQGIKMRDYDDDFSDTVREAANTAWAYTIGGNKKSLDELNDALKWNFKKIADQIEKITQVY